MRIESSKRKISEVKTKLDKNLCPDIKNKLNEPLQNRIIRYFKEVHRLKLEPVTANSFLADLGVHDFKRNFIKSDNEYMLRGIDSEGKRHWVTFDFKMFIELLEYLYGNK